MSTTIFKGGKNGARDQNLALAIQISHIHSMETMTWLNSFDYTCNAQDCDFPGPLALIWQCVVCNWVKEPNVLNQTWTCSVEYMYRQLTNTHFKNITPTFDLHGTTKSTGSWTCIPYMCACILNGDCVFFYVDVNLNVHDNIIQCVGVKRYTLVSNVSLLFVCSGACCVCQCGSVASIRLEASAHQNIHWQYHQEPWVSCCEVGYHRSNLHTSDHLRFGMTE